MALELVNKLPYDHPYRWDGTLFGGQKLWRPSELGADLALWLDAEDTDSITLNGGNVAQWSDKSGNNRNATQPTAASQPTYNTTEFNGKPAVVFDGVNDHLISGSGVYDDPITLYAVTRQNGGSSYLRIVNIGANTDVSGFFGSLDGNFATFFGDSQDWNDIAANSPLISLATNSIVGVVNASATATPYVNGLAQNTKVGTMGAATGVTIGALRNGVLISNWWNGPISEITLISSAITSEDRQKLEGYLAWKWGLTANLPADHPYKTTPPTA